MHAGQLGSLALLSKDGKKNVLGPGLHQDTHPGSFQTHILGHSRIPTATPYINSRAKFGPNLEEDLPPL